MKIAKGMFAVAALGLALGLGACNKNEDCCGQCKDKAIMHDGAEPASSKSKDSCCPAGGDKAVMIDGKTNEAAAKSGSCSKPCGEKMSCSDKTMTGDVQPASAKSGSCAKACGAKAASCADKSAQH